MVTISIQRIKKERISKQLDWPEFYRLGYRFSAGKRAWRVWYVENGHRIEIGRGFKRPSTPISTIKIRAMKFVIANWVKRRVEGNTFTNTKEDLRQQAMNNLIDWWTKKLDEECLKSLSTP